MQKNPQVLVLTVGTGTAGEFEATVLSPLRRSIEKGQWSRVILLPSRHTASNAFAVRNAYPDSMEVYPLRNEGDEENVDACFEQFERRLATLIEVGVEPQDVTADFTRGTKAMSAAMVLASVVHGVRTLRYITSPERDSRGMVHPGTETPRDFATSKVSVRRELERALYLIRAGQFAAAERICAFPPKGVMGKDVRWAHWIAKLWGLWDRFEYPEAHRIEKADGLPRRPAWTNEFVPSAANLKLLGRLSRPLPNAPNETEQWVAPCRDLTADILANARRRISEGHTEEALVRVYRVLELIGQYRLFSRGYDSSDLLLPPKLRRDFEETCGELRKNRDGRIQIGREQVASLLKLLSDPLADDLLNLNWTGELSPTARNKSILIHGFKTKTGKHKEAVINLLTRIEEFYFDENEGNRARFAAAEFPFLTHISGLSG